MSSLKKLISTLLGLVALVSVVIFFLSNANPVTVDLIVFEVPGVPLATWIIGPFIAGGVLGLLLNSLAAAKYQHRASRLEGQLIRSRTEVETPKS